MATLPERQPTCTLVCTVPVKRLYISIPSLPCSSRRRRVDANLVAALPERLRAEGVLTVVSAGAGVEAEAAGDQGRASGSGLGTGAAGGSHGASNAAVEEAEGAANHLNHHEPPAVAAAAVAVGAQGSQPSHGGCADGAGEQQGGVGVGGTAAAAQLGAAGPA